MSALTESAPILATEALTVRFGGLAAVNNVSISVPRGEIRGIIGPNGAGKSTFFNCLTGVLRPTSGRIEFNGEDIAGLLPHAISRKAIARSYQITNILPGATVLENVRIASQSRHHNWSMLRHHRAYTDVIDRARAVLADVGLAGKRGRARVESLARRAAQPRDRHRARDGAEAPVPRRADGRDERDRDARHRGSDPPDRPRT